MRMRLLALAAALVFTAAAVTALVEEPHEHGIWYMTESADGSMFISDAGTAIGGFEFTASYNASLVGTDGQSWVMDGRTATLSLSLEIGLGDPLSTHEILFGVTYDPGADTVLLDGDGGDVLLVHVSDDAVWDGQFDGYYIASWGGYAPEEELRGSISPDMFGLPEHYYVELRLQMTWIWMVE
jgi:hypothetical protein